MYWAHIRPATWRMFSKATGERFDMTSHDFFPHKIIYVHLSIDRSVDTVHSGNTSLRVRDKAPAGVGLRCEVCASV